MFFKYVDHLHGAQVVPAAHVAEGLVQIQQGLQNQNFSSVEELFPDVLFARFYIAYRAQKDMEKPDGELVFAARDYELSYEDGEKSEYYRRLKESTMKRFGFSAERGIIGKTELAEANNIALEKMKKYIYSNIPVLTYEEKCEMVGNVLDIFKTGKKEIPSGEGD